MPLDITAQEVDGAVERPAARLVLQLGIVEQRVLGDLGVEPLVGSHGERLHGGLLVAGPQIAVGQVVGGILRERILGAARLAQMLDGLVVAGRTIERKTAQVVGLAIVLAAGILESLQMIERGGEILQTETGLGDHALQLGAPTRHGAPGQFVARVDHILVIALMELDLQQIVRHQLAVGLAVPQSEKALLRTLVIAPDVSDIRDVIERMIGVLAPLGDAIEIAIGAVEIPVGEFGVSHADVELLATRGAQSPIIDRSERFAGTPHVAVGAIIRPQGEKRFVVVHRSGMPDDETPQRPLGILAAQLHGTCRQQEIDLLAGRPIGGIEHLAGDQKLVPGIAPTPEIEQLPPPVDKSARIVGRRPDGQTTAKQKEPRKKNLRIR